MPPRSTSIHMLAPVCPSSIDSSSIPQRAAEVPRGPANAKRAGASTTVTSWLRSRVVPNIPLACWSTRAPTRSGSPPGTQHSRTPGAHSGQRSTSQRYAHTSGALRAIDMRLSVLNVIQIPVQEGRRRCLTLTGRRVHAVRRPQRGHASVAPSGRKTDLLDTLRRGSRSAMSTREPGRLAASTKTP